MKISQLLFYFSICFSLIACGGSNPSPDSDTTAPAGYSATIAADLIDETNDTSVTISVTGAEVGAAYDYTFRSGSPEVSISGGGSVVESDFDIAGLNLTGLPAGEVTLTFILTDSSGNEGVNSTDSVSKTSLQDTIAPEGYLVSFLTDPIDDANESSAAFSIEGAEIGTTFNYVVFLSPFERAGSGEVVQEDFDITGLNLFGFPDGEITLEFSLTDGAGNVGSIVSDTVIKDTSALLSGTVTYDFVPHQEVGFGLDYDSIEQRPVRGATLQILDSANAVLVTTETDENGEYSVELNANQDVRVRVRAELLRSGGASWDFAVTDNTSGNAIYVLDGGLENIGIVDQARDLNAPSGWGFPGYTGERAAAPFAILDTVYRIVDKFVAIDPTIQFPAAEFRWSENNVPEDGDLAAGQISTSSYRSNGSTGNVYIMGAENVDTDEYDPHVIVHEWGHYFEDRLSRSDSVGGAHSIFDTLDMRVSFGEAWGNALSGIILDDPIYLDTGGEGQNNAGGFNIDWNEDPRNMLEPGDPLIPIGWYSEFSIQSIIYDLYDADPDGADVTSLGLEPIYQALIDPTYREQGTLTTIYSFLEQIKQDNASESSDIDGLAAAQDIFGAGFEGGGETNDGGLPEVLPVYRSATVNGAAVHVCSDNPFGEHNRLGNRQFVRVTLPSAGNYSFSAERVSGIGDADPEMSLIGPFPPDGERILRFFCGDSDAGDIETMDCSGLLAGEHVLEVFDAGNVDDLDGSDTTGGEVCFDVTITD